MTVTAYPLTWPAGRPRTGSPAAAKFRDGRDGGRLVDLDLARVRLDEQLRKITAANIILSMDIRLTLLGRRDMNVSRDEPHDKGAAVYFDLDGRPHVLACDRWDRVADNIAAIAAHIDALRAQERWGVADLRQAFAGHTALPAPPPWWQTLGLNPHATVADVEQAYRALAKTAHPNAGGDRPTWDRLQSAYDAAKRDRA